MRAVRPLLVLLVVLPFAALPAVAEGIIYFTNGNAMPVVSLYQRDGMVYADLGGGSVIAFPLELVERVEQADGKVVDDGYIANQRSGAGATAGAERVQAPPATMPKSYDGSVGVDQESGLATYRPLAGRNAPNRSGKQAVGNRAAWSRPLRPGSVENGGGGGFRGTTPMGSSHVIQKKIPPGAPGAKAANAVTPRMGGAAPESASSKSQSESKSESKSD